MGKEISSSRVHMSTARQFYESIEGQEALANSNKRSTTRLQMSNANESEEGQEALVNTNERNTTRVQMGNATRATKREYNESTDGQYKREQQRGNTTRVHKSKVNESVKGQEARACVVKSS